MYSICEHSVTPEGTDAPRKYWMVTYNGQGFGDVYESFDVACLAAAHKNAKGC